MSLKIPILHISHVNINYDSRILKEIDSINKLNTFEIYYFGVDYNEGAKNSEHVNHLVQFQINYFFNFKLFPKTFQFFFNLIELTIRFYFKSKKIKPKIIHCHDTFSLIAAVLIKWRYKSILIYDAHELESNKGGQSKISSILTLLIEKCCWKYIDYFISVSESIINWYNRELGTKHSCLILNSPQIDSIKNNHFKYETDYLRLKYSIPINKKIFIYVGAFVEYRSIDKLLNIFSSKNMTHHIVFLGYGPLSNEIANYSSIFQNIHLHQAVPHEEVTQLIKSADVGICILEDKSLSEDFALPNKLFEYVFSGLNILSSNKTEITNLINRFSLGIVTETDLDSICNSIENYPFENNYPKESINHLSWESQCYNLQKLYKDIISFNVV